MSNFVAVELSLFEHIVSITVIAATIIIILWVTVKSLLKRGRNKLTKIEASVLSKTTETCVNQPIFMQNTQITAGLTENRLTYSVLFKTTDGKELDFCVSKKLYDAVVEGQKDILVYKGDTLLQYGHLLNELLPSSSNFKGLQEDL